MFSFYSSTSKCWCF